MKHPKLTPNIKNKTSVGFVTNLPSTIVKDANPSNLRIIILLVMKFNVAECVMLKVVRRETI